MCSAATGNGKGERACQRELHAAGAAVAQLRCTRQVCVGGGAHLILEVAEEVAEVDVEVSARLADHDVVIVPVANAKDADVDEKLEEYGADDKKKRKAATAPASPAKKKRTVPSKPTPVSTGDRSAATVPHTGQQAARDSVLSAHPTGRHNKVAEGGNGTGAGTAK